MPTPLRVYFIRHGESVANQLSEFSNRRDNVHPLTEKGVEQAVTLAAHLREQIGTGRRAAVYSSPLLRARQTAEIAAEALGVPCLIEEALREFDTGINEGRSDAEAWARFSALWDDWFLRELLDSRIEDGESLSEVRARFLPFFEGLLAHPPADDLILVSHGGLWLCVLPVILSNVDIAYMQSHGLGNTQYALAEQREDRLVCVEWCGYWPFTERGDC